MSNNKLKLTETQQKIYNYLYEQISVHGNISISRKVLAEGFGVSEMTARRTTDFITLNPMKQYGLKQIYSAQILNYIVYSFNEFHEVSLIDELSIHMILKMPYLGEPKPPFQLFEDEDIEF